MQNMALPRPEFWRGKKVLVTGHTGFIGSWLSLWLHEWGAHVVGVALPPENDPNLFTLLKLEERITHYLADLRDFSSIAGIVETEKPDIILHLAAQALVRPAFHQPVETFASNVMGTTHLLEAVRQANLAPEAMIIFTTDKVYENNETGAAFREGDRLGGYEPYGISKACCELVVEAFRHSYFQDSGLATMRAGNVIGGGDWAVDRLIPDAMRAFMQNEPLIIRHPNAIRPWQHVLEPVRAMMMLCEKLAADPKRYAGGWNIGPDRDAAKEVGWIADYMTKAYGGDSSWQHQKTDQIYEAKLLMLDHQKITDQIGWKPAWPIEKALDFTVAWYKAFAENNNADFWTLSRHQWEQYINEVSYEQ